MKFHRTLALAGLVGGVDAAFRWNAASSGNEPKPAGFKWNVPASSGGVVWKQGAGAFLPMEGRRSIGKRANGSAGRRKADELHLSDLARCDHDPCKPEQNAIVIVEEPMPTGLPTILENIVTPKPTPSPTPCSARQWYVISTTAIAAECTNGYDIPPSAVADTEFFPSKDACCDATFAEGETCVHHDVCTLTSWPTDDPSGAPTKAPTPPPIEEIEEGCFDARDWRMENTRDDGCEALDKENLRVECENIVGTIEGVTGILAKEACRETCGECEPPPETEDATDSPTTAPTKNPTVAPTSAPTEGPCVCSPQEFTFKIDLNGTCPDGEDQPVVVDGANYTCEIDTERGPPNRNDVIRIVETDSSGEEFRGLTDTSPFESGYTFNYTSISAHGKVPTELKIVITDKEKDEENTIVISYTNECGVEPFEDGDAIGWIIFEDIKPASDETCGVCPSSSSGDWGGSSKSSKSSKSWSSSVSEDHEKGGATWASPNWKLRSIFGDMTSEWGAAGGEPSENGEKKRKRKKCSVTSSSWSSSKTSKSSWSKSSKSWSGSSEVHASPVSWGKDDSWGGTDSPKSWSSSSHDADGVSWSGSKSSKSWSGSSDGGDKGHDTESWSGSKSSKSWSGSSEGGDNAWSNSKSWSKSSKSWGGSSEGGDKAWKLFWGGSKLDEGEDKPESTWGGGILKTRAYDVSPKEKTSDWASSKGHAKKEKTTGWSGSKDHAKKEKGSWSGSKDHAKKEKGSWSGSKDHAKEKGSWSGSKDHTKEKGSWSGSKDHAKKEKTTGWSGSKDHAKEKGSWSGSKDHAKEKGSWSGSKDHGSWKSSSSTSWESSSSDTWSKSTKSSKDWWGSSTSWESPSGDTWSKSSKSTSTKSSKDWWGSATTGPTTGSDRESDIVESSADLPILADDLVQTNMNEDVTFLPLENDPYIPDGAGGSFTDPANGAIALQPDGVVYTPSLDFCGTDGFTYTVTDATGQFSATAAVTIVVACTEAIEDIPANEQPILNDDAAETNSNTPVSIAVLDNDSYVPPSGSASMAQPSHGTATIERDSVLYVPDEDFCGTDQFTYTVTDVTGQFSDTATVTVIVICSTVDVVETTTTSPTSASPVANDDFATANQGASVVLLLLDNDVVPEGATGSFTEPSNGSLGADGADLTYTPNPGFCGEDSFSYSLSVGDLSDSATVTIDVVCASGTTPTTTTGPTDGNDSTTPPAITALSLEDDFAEGNMNEELSIPVLDNDTLPANAGGTFGEPMHGQVVKPTENGLIYMPNEDWCGIDTFEYVITSGGLSDSANVTVHILCDGAAANLPANAKSGETEETTTSESMSSSNKLVMGFVAVLGSTIVVATVLVSMRDRSAATGEKFDEKKHWWTTLYRADNTDASSPLKNLSMKGKPGVSREIQFAGSSNLSVAAFLTGEATSPEGSERLSFFNGRLSSPGAGVVPASPATPANSLFSAASSSLSPNSTKDMVIDDVVDL